MLQRNAQAGLETQRRQGQGLSQARVKLQAELANLQDNLEREARDAREE